MFEADSHTQMNKPTYCFDEKCLDLARYFYPAAPEDRLRDLAQRLQDEVESEDIDTTSPETGEKHE